MRCHIKTLLGLLLPFGMLFTACSENDPPQEPPLQSFSADVRILIEDEGGDNLLNPSNPNNIIPEKPNFKGNIYVKYDRNVLPANWDEYNDPAFSWKFEERYSPFFFVRRMNLTKHPWETWDASVYSNDDYSLVLYYKFQWFGGPIKKDYHIYIDGIDASHTITISHTPDLKHDDEKQYELSQYYLDGVEVKELPIKIIIPSDKLK